VVAGLVADLTVRRDAFTLELALTAGPGEVVVLLGPNAAGKSTALRALAGLLPLDAGRIAVDDAVLADPDSGIQVPPHARPVGVVFQDYLLFPHLSVLDNVAFGPQAHGVRRADARRHARSWLERIGIAELAGSRPRSISGGQAQRVAVARALATEPALLLLDEPLAALDARTRLQVRAELRRHLTGFAGATVLVTHDPVDAAVLGTGWWWSRTARWCSPVRRPRWPATRGPTMWPGWSGSTCWPAGPSVSRCGCPRVAR
jgi:molybdate transport system ATP-binding protein